MQTFQNSTITDGNIYRANKLTLFTWSRKTLEYTIAIDSSAMKVIQPMIHGTTNGEFSYIIKTKPLNFPNLNPEYTNAKTCEFPLRILSHYPEKPSNRAVFVVIIWNFRYRVTSCITYMLKMKFSPILVTF